MSHYYVLIVDIKKSRDYDYKERESLQNLISGSLKHLNRLFDAGIEKPVMFSAGDEVQGLFRDPTTAYLYYRMLSLLLRPDAIRGGIGAGNWQVRMDDTDSTVQDGTAYYHARDAIVEAKANRYYDIVFRSGSLQDDVGTVLMDHSMGICKMRTTMQNDMALVIELLFPLVSGRQDRSEEWGAENGRSSDHARSADSDSLREIFELLSRYMNTMPNKPRKPDLVKGILRNYEHLSTSFPRKVFLDGHTSSKGEPHVLLKGDLQGVSYELSELSGMTRQGIDRQLTRGRIAQERSAVAVLSCAFEECVSE